MWWLHSEERTVQVRDQSSQPTPNRHSQVPFPGQAVPAQAVPRQPVPRQAIHKHPANHQAVVKRHIAKCDSPLIDTLTPQQEQANRVLSQFQCGHEFEIERLLADVNLLEKALRETASKAESQQNIIEQKEGLRQSAEEAAKILDCSLSELDREVQRLDQELQQREKTHEVSLQENQQQIAQCEYQAMLSEHRVAELSTVVQNQLKKLGLQCDEGTQQIAIQNRQIEWFDRISEQWQSQAFKLRSQNERLNNELRQRQAKIDALDDQLVNSESIICQKDQELGELAELRVKLASAEKRAATWQIETQRSHASRRALAEQMRRQKAVDEEAIRRANLQREQCEQKNQVAQLRMERLRSKNLHLEKQLHAERAGRVNDRRIRESEISETQNQVRAKAIQTEQLKASVEMRDREIIGLKDTIAATQVELNAAWECSKEAANHLQLRDAELRDARDKEERFVQIQSDQASSLQSRIDGLVSELETLQNEFDTVQESSRMDIDGFERLLSDLESVIEQLGFDHEQMRTALDLAQQTNASLLSQAAKSRAQLAGGRAKGALLIERYQERLRLAIETIQTLRNQAERSGNENRRAA